MTKEDLIDHHIHLHNHEIIPGRWLRPGGGRTKIFAGFLCAAILAIGIIGAFWFL